MTVRPELTEQECQWIFDFIHHGLKSEGRKALLPAWQLNLKIEQAILAAQKAANDPPVAVVMPPVSESAAQG